MRDTRMRAVTAGVALFALALQLLLSFGHVHGWRSTSIAAGVASATPPHTHQATIAFGHADMWDSGGGTITAATPCADHRQADRTPDRPNHHGDLDCTICRSVAERTAVVLPAVAAAVLQPSYPAPDYRLAASVSRAATAVASYQPRAPPA